MILITNPKLCPRKEGAPIARKLESLWILDHLESTEVNILAELLISFYKFDFKF